MEGLIRLENVRAATPKTALEKMVENFPPLPFGEFGAVMLVIILSAIALGLSGAGAPDRVVFGMLATGMMLIFTWLFLPDPRERHTQRVLRRWRAEIEKLDLGQLEAAAKSSLLTDEERCEIERLLKQRRAEHPLRLTPLDARTPGEA